MRRFLFRSDRRGKRRFCVLAVDRDHAEKERGTRKDISSCGMDPPWEAAPGKGPGRGDTFWFILRLAAFASWEQGSEPPGSGRIFKQQKNLDSYESRLYAEDGT